FVMGLFWKKATPNAALITAVLSIPLSAGMKVLTPALPFIHRMGLVFLISVALITVISLIEGKGKDSPKAVSLDGIQGERDGVFTLSAFAILGITAALYLILW
ncbi:MAG: SSS family solute:Na+ symporter, partial [Rhodothermales bacterium]